MNREILKAQMEKGSAMIIEKMASIGNCPISEIEYAIKLSKGSVYNHYIKAMSAMAARLIAIQA